MGILKDSNVTNRLATRKALIMDIPDNKLTNSSIDDRIGMASLPSLRDLAKYADGLSPTSDDETTSLATLASVNKAIDQTRRYFTNAKSILGELQSEDDVEFIYQGRQAVHQVDSDITAAGNVMSQLMNALEDTRNEHSGKKSPIYRSYMPIVSKIEAAIKEWQETLAICHKVKTQVAISSEWKDLYEKILTDIESEIQTCFNISFAIQEERHLLGSGLVDVGQLSNAMNSTPFAESKKLPNLTLADDEINSKFLDLLTKMKPLQMSLTIIPMRIETYASKANEWFPTSITSLQSKYAKLEEKWQKLTTDVSVLETELVENRWRQLFQKAARQAFDKLNSLEENIRFISLEESLQHPEAAKIERYCIMNAQLIPIITRTIALLDQAITERLVTGPDMFAMQSSLHQTWSQMSLQAMQNSTEGSSAVNHGRKTNGFMNSVTKLIPLQAGKSTMNERINCRVTGSQRTSISVFPSEKNKPESDNLYSHQRSDSAVSSYQSSQSSLSTLDELLASPLGSPLPSPDTSPTLNTRFFRLRGRKNVSLDIGSTGSIAARLAEAPRPAPVDKARSIQVELNNLKRSNCSDKKEPIPGLLAVAKRGSSPLKRTSTRKSSLPVPTKRPSSRLSNSDASAILQRGRSPESLPTVSSPVSSPRKSFLPVPKVSSKTSNKRHSDVGLDMKSTRNDQSRANACGRRSVSHTFGSIRVASDLKNGPKLVPDGTMKPRLSLGRKPSLSPRKSEPPSAIPRMPRQMGSVPRRSMTPKAFHLA